MARKKCPTYQQKAPNGLYTIAELERRGLKVRLDEWAAGILKVTAKDLETTCGLYRLDQCEPAHASA